MIELGALGYGAVGALYALLVMLLATAWSGARTGAYLIVAGAVSCLWGGIVSLSILGVFDSVFALFAAEIARGAAWLAFLGAVLSLLGASRMLVYLAHAAWLGAFAYGLFAFYGGNAADGAEGPGMPLIPGGLVMALAGLVLIEQLYRNATPEARSGIKALALGVGGIFAYDLFLYSQGLLFGVLDTTAWLARGAVNLLFVPLIAVSAKRSPAWELDLFVSRQVVFYTTALLAVGLYLVLMSAGGYLILIYGGTWGALAQIVFATGAVLVLTYLLFSRTLRARIKVFITKHFFRNKYDYREEWLRLVSTLSEFEDSSTRQIVIKAMAQVVDSPGGVLWVLSPDGRSYRVTAVFGEDRQVPDIDAGDPLVRFILEERWLVDLDEYVANPGHYGGLILPDWMREDDKAWLIVPLVLKHDLMGMILLDHGPESYQLNYEDRDLLKTIGSHIAVHLAQERSDSLLAESQQFEAYNRLTAFLMHDLNNLIAQQSLIVSNSEQHKRNPEFVDDAMQTIAGSVKRMRRIMDQLKRGEATRPARSTELRFLVSAAVDRCVQKKPAPVLELNGVDSKVSVDAEQCIMVLVHLIKNAQEATPENGRVEVSLDRKDGRVDIVITDNGSGMSGEFIRERLFRPFDTTKGSQGMGIGAYQAREFARNMKGDLTVRSSVPGGTTVTLSLPVAG